jgi:hypothetical protein
MKCDTYIRPILGQISNADTAAEASGCSFRQDGKMNMKDEKAGRGIETAADRFCSMQSLRFSQRWL